MNAKESIFVRGQRLFNSFSSRLKMPKPISIPTKKHVDDFKLQLDNHLNIFIIIYLIMLNNQIAKSLLSVNWLSRNPNNITSCGLQIRLKMCKYFCANFFTKFAPFAIACACAFVKGAQFFPSGPVKMDFQNLDSEIKSLSEIFLQIHNGACYFR